MKRIVKAGNVTIGNGNISIQSMSSIPFSRFEELKEQMQKQYEYHQSILSDEAEKAKFNDRQIGYMEAYTQEFIKEKQQDVVNYILGCWPGKMAEKFAEAIGYSK